jgi:flagellar basal-body rod protein FlgB
MDIKPGMDSLDRQFGIHADALRLRSQRLGVLATNIANAATPGFKARDFDVAAALRGSGGFGGGFGAELGSQLRYRVPVQASLDGNTVELATEQTEFAKNALQYQASLSFLTGRIQTIMSALKGGE